MLPSGFYPLIDSTKTNKWIAVSRMDNDGISTRHYVTFLAEPRLPAGYRQTEYAFKLTEVDIKRIAIISKRQGF